MKYLCLVYGEEKRFEAIPRQRVRGLRRGPPEGGHCLAAEALQPVHTATTVRVRHGNMTVWDGPFAETKEQLAGFYLIDARDLNEALQLAARILPARVGSIEVRPIRPLRNTAAQPPHRADVGLRAGRPFGRGYPRQPEMVA